MTRCSSLGHEVEGTNLALKDNEREEEDWWGMYDHEFVSSFITKVMKACVSLWLYCYFGFGII